MNVHWHSAPCQVQEKKKTACVAAAAAAVWLVHAFVAPCSVCLVRTLLVWCCSVCFCDLPFAAVAAQVSIDDAAVVAVAVEIGSTACQEKEWGSRSAVKGGWRHWLVDSRAGQARRRTAGQQEPCRGNTVDEGWECAVAVVAADSVVHCGDQMVPVFAGRMDSFGREHRYD